VPYNNVEFQAYERRCGSTILIQSGFQTGSIINLNDVKSAVERLQAHKNDGDVD